MGARCKLSALAIRQSTSRYITEPPPGPSTAALPACLLARQSANEPPLQPPLPPPSLPAAATATATATAAAACRRCRCRRPHFDALKHDGALSVLRKTSHCCCQESYTFAAAVRNCQDVCIDERRDPDELVCLGGRRFVEQHVLLQQVTRSFNIASRKRSRELFKRKRFKISRHRM